MGMNFMRRSSDNRTPYSYDAPPPDPTDPNPAIFTILNIGQHGRFVVALIRYPNCTNFSGQKILVWENRTVREIKAQRLIDPHFLDSDESLVARFIPTEKGWKMALKFVAFDR